MKIKKTLKVLWYYRDKPVLAIKRGYYRKLMKYPSAVVLIASKNCNLKCNFCSVRDYVGKGFERNMTFNEFKIVIDKTHFFNPTYSLFGGEPLLNKDIFKIMDYIKVNGCDAVIYTNATLINDEIAKKLARSNLLMINISIDGYRDTHNMSRGRPIFDDAYNGLKLVRHYLNKYNNKKTKIRLICTFTDVFNEKDFEFMKHLKEKNIVDFINFGHLMFDHNINEDTLKNYLKLTDFFFKIPLDNYTPPNMTMEDVKEWYSKERLPDHWKCNLSGIDIFPDGSITRCFYHKDKILGNILKQNFKDIWNSQLRKEIDRNKMTYEGCFRCPVNCPR